MYTQISTQNSIQLQSIHKVSLVVTFNVLHVTESATIHALQFAPFYVRVHTYRVTSACVCLPAINCFSTILFFTIHINQYRSLLAPYVFLVVHISVSRKNHFSDGRRGTRRRANLKYTVLGYAAVAAFS